MPLTIRRFDVDVTVRRGTACGFGHGWGGHRESRLTRPSASADPVRRGCGGAVHRRGGRDQTCAVPRGQRQGDQDVSRAELTPGRDAATAEPRLDTWRWQKYAGAWCITPGSEPMSSARETNTWFATTLAATLD